MSGAWDKEMDLGEFRDRGYLQEVNRLFFHPLGLALGVTQAEDGTLELGPVYDLRDDPEGGYFSSLDAGDVARGLALAREGYERGRARLKALGYVVQPLAVDGS